MDELDFLGNHLIIHRRIAVSVKFFLAYGNDLWDVLVSKLHSIGKEEDCLHVDTTTSKFILIWIEE